MPFYASPESFVPDTSIGFLCKRVFQANTMALEPMFAEAGTSYVQWSAMVSLWNGRADTCAALARELCHDTGATTRLIDLLESRGWVERERSGEDRRVVHLRLTAAGKAITERCRAGVAEQWNAWLADWDPADVDRLIGDLQRLRHRIETGTPCA